VVGRAYVNVSECGGRVKEFVGDAAVGDGLPDEEWLGRWGREAGEAGAAQGEYVGDEADAALWGADEVERLGSEQGGRVEEITGFETQFWSRVFKRAVLGVVSVAVPAAGGEARGIGAQEARGLP